MRTNDGSIRMGQTLVVGLMAAALGALAIAGPALQGQTTEPATMPAAPTTPVPAAPAAATGFSEQEAVLINSVTDGNSELVSTPLSILLKHAALLPDGGVKAEKMSLNALLVADPQEYREKFKLVSFEGWYAGKCEEKEAAGKEEWWPAGTFYLMHVAGTTDRDSPIVLVALTKAPPSSLRTGSKVGFTGYFYKNVLLPLKRDEDTKKTNVVLVAKGGEIVSLEEPAGGGSSSRTWGLLAAIVTLLGLGLYFQMRVKAHKQQAAMHQRVQALTHQPEEDADFDIDPQLQQEVERFEAELDAAHHPKDNV